MSGGDAKFFTSHKRGEVAEWREEINSTDKDVQKNAIKRIIANMSIGKDVSMLFPDVVNRAQTNDVELKKLVYLYLLNYARSQPELTILAVNTFVKDSADPNPLIRALAVRTMGCIRVEKITEYLCDPLQRTLTDEDPYVRKTAAICVAKLHDINPELVEDRGFVDQLRELLADANPMVVANAVAALTEIRDASAGDPKRIFQLNANNVYKLLAALNECTEWGQVFILDSLASYVARDEADAKSVVERVTPRLQHANCAVVLSAVKVIMSQMRSITSSPETTRALVRKLAPPLVTLLGAECEIQYVALRNINLIVQKYPEMLTGEIKVFFCKYNDPIYVKQEKLETMVKLSSEANIDQVLLEFKEYATEVDVDFVRKAVRAIGRCAISIEAAAERCIGILLELIGTKVNYVVQEAIVVIKDIFRRYPNQYEGVIGVLCDSLDTLDEPEAKASMVWIIGEYAERIDNAEELLEAFLDTFLEEAPEVQLQLLTATVKLFLKKPSGGPQALIQTVLNQATSETDDPDLRDRAYIYWRLLSSDPEAAKDVVLATKPTIRDDRNALDPGLLDELLRQVSTLSSVYHKLPSAFVPDARARVSEARDDESRRGGAELAPLDVLQIGEQAQPSAPAPARAVDLLADLMGATAVAPAPGPPPRARRTRSTRQRRRPRAASAGLLAAAKGQGSRFRRRGPRRARRARVRADVHEPHRRAAGRVPAAVQQERVRARPRGAAARGDGPPGRKPALLGASRAHRPVLGPERDGHAAGGGEVALAERRGVLLQRPGSPGGAPAPGRRAGWRRRVRAAVADESGAGAPGGGARRAGRRRPGGRPDLCAALEPGDPAGHGGDAVRRRVLFREDARTRG